MLPQPFSCRMMTIIIGPIIIFLIKDDAECKYNYVSGMMCCRPKLKFKKQYFVGGWGEAGNKARAHPHPIPEIPYCGMLDQDMGGERIFSTEYMALPFIKTIRNYY